MVNLTQILLVFMSVNFATRVKAQGVNPPPPACPPGWSVIGSDCRPDLPSAQFFRDSNNYPVCGAERVPVKMYGGTVTSLNVATSGVPRTGTNAAVTFPSGSTNIYNYSAPSSTGPTYLYQGYNECMCVGTTWPAVPLSNNLPQDTGPTVSSGTNTTVQRFLPTTISALTLISELGNLSAYGPVAISKTTGGGTDPRLGTAYSNGTSVCGCPNFNEMLQLIAPGSAEPSGAVCVPRVHSSDPQIQVRLVTFNSAVHDPPGVSKVMNRDNEPKDSDGHLITQIALPYSITAYNYTGSYQRKIWVCDPISAFNTSTGACEITNSYHAPGPGSSTIPASEVSPRARGNTEVERWNNTINKKFAACLNGFGTNSSINATSGQKLDCISNDFIHYSDFNDLWSSTDKADDGGLPNAIALANAEGGIISGFYQLDGKRCNEYNEFAGVIQPAILNPKTKGIPYSTPEIENVGEPIKTPGSGNGGATVVYNDMKSKFRAAPFNAKIPSERGADEMRRCPLLVRAAAIFSCPDNVTGQPIVTYETSSSGIVTRRQCTVAKDIKIQLRIEQVYQIRGTLTAPTYDTVANPGASSAVAIQRIIAEKYGRGCPGNMRHDNVTGECTVY